MTERITAADLKARQATATKGNRRVAGARPVVVDGIRFPSEREARRWGELKLLQKAGRITGLERQVAIPLQGRDGPILTDSGEQVRRYIADFRYWDVALGAWVIEDAKGHPTEIYRIKRAIVEAMGVTVHEV